MDSNTRMSRCHEDGVGQWTPEEGSPIEGRRFKDHVHLSGAPCLVARKKSLRGTSRVRREQEFIMVSREQRCQVCSLYLDRVYDRHYRPKMVGTAWCESPVNK